MRSYRLQRGCPNCGRMPNVQFSEQQVRRSQMDRAAGLHSEIQCPRCGHRWWIRNREVGQATPVRIKEPSAKLKKKKQANKETRSSAG